MSSILDLVDGPPKKARRNLLDLVDGTNVPTPAESMIADLDAGTLNLSSETPGLDAIAQTAERGALTEGPPEPEATIGDPRASEPSDPDWEQARQDSDAIDRVWRKVRESGPVRGLLGRSEAQRATVAAFDDGSQRVDRMENEGLLGMAINAWQGQIPRIGPQASTMGQLGAGAVNAASGLAESLAAPLGMLSMGAAQGAHMVQGVAGVEQVVGRLFAGDMLGHAPGQMVDAGKAYLEGDTQGAVEAGLGALGSLHFGVSAAKHGFGPVLDRDASAPGAMPLPNRLARELDSAVDNEFTPKPLTTWGLNMRDQVADRGVPDRFVPVRPREGTFEYVPAGRIPDLAPDVASRADLETIPEVPAESGVAPAAAIEPVVGASRVPTAETITGFNEGKASEMPAEGVEPRPEAPAGNPALAVEVARSVSSGPPSPVKQVPEPAYFGSIDEVLTFRNTRLAEERQLYADQIGLDETQAAKLQGLVHRDRDTTKFERGLTSTQKQKLAEFWDGPWNKRDSSFQAWEIDSRLNPEELSQEKDADVLASALISAVERGIDTEINNDRFVSALIAGRRLLDLGFTKSDVARQLDRYSTSISGSQSDKAATFQSLGLKLNEFLTRAGIKLPDGDLTKPQLAPVARISPEAPAGNPDAIFGAPESVADQTARLASDKVKAEKKRERNELRARADAPLKGKAIDTTGDLLDADKAENPLFAAKTPAPPPPPSVEVTPIPELPPELVRAIIADKAPNVAWVHTRWHFGVDAANALPETGATAADFDVLKKAKAMARAKGWDWKTVEEMARVGLDADWLKPGSHEANMMVEMRSAQTKASIQRRVNREQSLKDTDAALAKASGPRQYEILRREIRNLFDDYREVEEAGGPTAPAELASIQAAKDGLQARLNEVESATEGPREPATPAPAPAPAVEVTPIPELPPELVRAIVADRTPDVIREHTRRQFGQREADAIPYSGASDQHYEIINKAKATARTKGWDWKAVEEMARGKAGLDADWLKPESHEANTLASMRAEDTKAAARRVRRREQQLKDDAEVTAELQGPDLTRVLTRQIRDLMVDYLDVEAKGGPTAPAELASIQAAKDGLQARLDANENAMDVAGVPRNLKEWVAQQEAAKNPPPAPSRLTPAEAVELNELRVKLENKGKLPKGQQARMIALDALEVSQGPADPIAFEADESLMGGAKLLPKGSPTVAKSTKPRRTAVGRALELHRDQPMTLVDMVKAGGPINLAPIVEAHPNWAPSAGLRRYFKPNRGRKWDVVAKEAFEIGVLQTEPLTAQEFVEALDAHYAQYKEVKGVKGKEQAYGDLSAEQAALFEAKVLNGERAKDQDPPHQIPPDSLLQGDKFKSDGVRFEVTKLQTDEDGNVLAVHLKDGPKYGEQIVGPERPLHIDPGTLTSKAAVGAGGGGGDAFSIGSYPGGHPVTLGNVTAIRPTQSPEILRLAQALGMEVRAAALRGNASGVFRGVGAGRIELDRTLFFQENVHQLASVIAHEIGHGFDWLPEGSLDRGNLLGRIASLHRFLSTTMPRNPYQDINTRITPADRRRFRRIAGERAGTRPPRHDVDALARWRDAAGEHYQELVNEAIIDRDLVQAGDVHAELWALSREWRPLEARVSDEHLAYRRSSRELYADAISVLLNNPGMLEGRAPVFYKMFFDFLHRKPAVEREFFDLQELLTGGEAALAQRRRSQDVAGMIRGEETLRVALNQERDAMAHPHGWAARLKQELVDRGGWLGDQVDRLRASGVRISPDLDPRVAWEESNWASSEHALTSERVHREVVAPVFAAGLDLRTLGELLRAERISGGMGARAILEMRIAELGAGYARVKAQANELSRRLSRGEARVDILAELDRAGQPADLIDEVRQNLLDAGSRSDLANPAAESPESIQATLRSLQASMRPDQWAALRAAADAFRQVVFEKMAEGVQHGVINRYTFDTTITANKSWYATFRGLEHVDEHVTPFIRQAQGSLGDTENPFMTTMLKLLSVNNVMLRNRAKLLTRDLFMQHHPDSFREAVMVHDGVSRRPVAPPRNLERLEMHDNGVLRHYDVDPYFAAAFETVTPATVSGLVKLVNASFAVIYPVIIKYNPAFQLMTNPIRDFRRSARNLGAIRGRGGRLSLLREYVASYRTAMDFVAGRPNETVTRMMEAKALGTPMEGFGQSSGMGRGGEESFGNVMEHYRVMTPRERTLWARTAAWLPHAIARQGARMEALPKIAGFRILTRPEGVRGPRFTDRDAATLVRRYVGTPDFNVKGSHGSVHNALVPFLNIFIQGYRGDINLARHPTTAGGFWFRYLLGSGSRAALMGMAAAGVFGDRAKEAYAGVSEYDKSNHDIVPVGYQDGGEFGHKVIYLRMPRDESGRVMGAAIYKLTRLAAEAAMGKDVSAGRVGSEVWASLSAVVPSVSPILDVAQAWNDYVRGAPPIDGFRNRPIVPEREWSAGGWAAIKPMLKWTVGKTGILNIFSYNPEADTTTEMVMSGTPVLKGLLKVSDYGYQEIDAQSDRTKIRDKARARMMYSEDVRFMASEHDRIGKVPVEKRTPDQRSRWDQLHVWHQDYRRIDEKMIEASDAGAKDMARAYADQMNVAGEAFRMAVKATRETDFKFKPVWQ